MKIAVVNVTLRGFHLPSSVPSRRTLLVDVLRQVRRERADLAILPGGFLTVAMESEVGNVLNPVLAEIQSIGIAVVIGVDVGKGKQLDKSIDHRVENQNVQAFAVAWSPADGVVGGLTWRQRSITASHTKLLRELVARGRVAPSTLTNVRSITVSGERAGVLICGEMFNKDIRNAYMTDNKLGLVVDIGHTGHRWRAFQGLSALTDSSSKLSAALACAHVKWLPGQRYCYPKSSKQVAPGAEIWPSHSKDAVASVFSV